MEIWLFFAFLMKKKRRTSHSCPKSNIFALAKKPSSRWTQQWKSGWVFDFLNNAGNNETILAHNRGAFLRMSRTFSNCYFYTKSSTVETWVDFLALGKKKGKCSHSCANSNNSACAQKHPKLFVWAQKSLKLLVSQSESNLENLGDCFLIFKEQ